MPSRELKVTVSLPFSVLLASHLELTPFHLLPVSGKLSAGGPVLLEE